MGTVTISRTGEEDIIRDMTVEEEAQMAKDVAEEEIRMNEYTRNRQAEYPSIAELTVALYDTDDKSAVEAKRAAVKAKYPKPS